MLHTIGRKHLGGGDLVDMLLECHVRIRTFSSLAIAVGEHADAPLGEVVDVCMRVERYFADALPLHMQDEEESVLPRLRGHSLAIDAALDRMHEQHETHQDLLQQLLASSAALRADPGDATARAALLGVALPLQSVLEPHLQAEEEILFPAVRALVSSAEQVAMVGELRARRRSVEAAPSLP